MKPRIFISSTFYDLKYIREDLANFVRSYGYEPILFEDGDIGYTPGKTLDSSCYESMKNSDMVILIIGGEYGSAASGEKRDGFKDYISVTRNEFRTAIDSGIPVFAMIDKNVMAEYRMYEANYDLIEKEKKELNFVSTKNVNVLRFIKEVRGIVALPVQEFEKTSDIKGFISKQWADMFKNYLSSLRNERENKKIENSVNEMKALIQKMDIMLDSVGKNVLSKENSNEYEKVINQQEIVSFCNILIQSFRFKAEFSNKLENQAEKEKIIRKFFKALNEMKDSGIKYINAAKLDDVLIIFDKYNFYMTEITSHFENVSKEMDLLNDEKTTDEVVKNMTKDEYFYKLVER